MNQMGQANRNLFGQKPRQTAKYTIINFIYLERDHCTADFYANLHISLRT